MKKLIGETRERMVFVDVEKNIGKEEDLEEYRRLKGMVTRMVGESKKRGMEECNKYNL